MALLTFPWSDIGWPNEIEVIDICHTIRHPYGGGYQARRSAASKMQKAFPTTWTASTPAQWLAFVSFWRSVRGTADAFYWEFPSELYGSPGYGGYGELEPDDGFDADQLVGAGQGPIFTVYFDLDEQPQKHLTGFNRWGWSTVFYEVA